MLESMLTVAYEQYIIDDDINGQAMRLVRGLEITEASLSLDVIHDVCTGEGHYLGHPQTLALMQTEYLYPEVADRRTAGEWEVTGKEDVSELAHQKVQDILSSHYPDYISRAADRRIREHFPVRLDRADMQPGNGRW